MRAGSSISGWLVVITWVRGRVRVRARVRVKVRVRVRVRVKVRVRIVVRVRIRSSSPRCARVCRPHRRVR